MLQLFTKPNADGLVSQSISVLNLTHPCCLCLHLRLRLYTITSSSRVVFRKHRLKRARLPSPLLNGGYWSRNKTRRGAVDSAELSGLYLRWGVCIEERNRQETRDRVWRAPSEY